MSSANEPEYDPLIEEILRETEWMETAPPTPSFDHSFMRKAPREVFAALCEIDLPAIPGVPGLCWTKPLPDEIFRLAPLEQGTILWHDRSSVGAMARLSEVLGCDVHWITAYEDMTCRAYAHFRAGQANVLIRDPVAGFERSYWEAEDLMGRGVRDYASLADFLAAIAPYYRPVDQYWGFRRWEWPGDAKELQIAEGEWKAVERCIQVSFEVDLPRLEPIGDWSPAEFRSVCERDLGVKLE